MLLQCKIFDSMELTSREITAEGYLKAPAALARTGIQMYRAREFPALTQQGVDPNKLIRLHRPAEEVFHPDSMASFEAKPVIVEPHQNVNAGNWRDVAVGDVHGIHREGELLKATTMMVRDKKAVEAIHSGKKYLSNGYTFDLDLTPGTTADGQAYDGIQRNIRGNHVAITDMPRGGPACKIADSSIGAKHMTKIVIDGIPFEAEDALTAAVNKLIQERDTARNQQPSVTLKIGDASKTVTGSDAIIKELDAKDAEIAELRKKVITPEQLEKMIADRVEQRTQLIGDALRMTPDYKPEGKSDKQVRIDVIAAVTAKDTVAKTVADALLSGKTLEAADDALLLSVYNSVSAVAGKGSAVHTGDTAVADALTSGKEGRTQAGDADDKPHGREAFLERMQNAWMGGK